MSYTMVRPSSDTLEDDEIYDYESAEGQGFRVICDPKSLLYIWNAAGLQHGIDRWRLQLHQSERHPDLRLR